MKNKAGLVSEQVGLCDLFELRDLCSFGLLDFIGRLCSVYRRDSSTRRREGSLHIWTARNASLLSFHFSFGSHLLPLLLPSSAYLSESLSISQEQSLLYSFALIAIIGVSPSALFSSSALICIIHSGASFPFFPNSFLR